MVGIQKVPFYLGKKAHRYFEVEIRWSAEIRVVDFIGSSPTPLEGSEAVGRVKGSVNSCFVGSRSLRRIYTFYSLLGQKRLENPDYASIVVLR